MDKTYIIAEIGQNHNGDLNIAKQLIDAAAMTIKDESFDRTLHPINAIKLTKRDLSEELAFNEMQKTYNSKHSYGKTYFEHREALELSYEEHEELFYYAKSKNLDVIETLCSPKTLQLLDKVTPDYLKVASRDLSNVPLLIELGKTKIPIILSTGMSNLEEIEIAIETIENFHSNISILHCLSQYPADYANLNLFRIPELVRRYGSQYKIGYSDHSIGIMAPILSIGLGAQIIEKHITLDHNMKGSDHKSALEPDGLWRMTRDIRNAEASLGSSEIIESAFSKQAKEKLERSLAAKDDIPKNTILQEDMIVMLSPGTGLKWKDKNKILNKKTFCAIKKGELFNDKMFE
ncbi:shikimate dehydrogenase [Candidatus Marinamargulisbacteria bacterium SCGC AG-414-C22]|nr:shikimate dehydrogenase [Candidatus Marinamargulisbacteria bacterium SCGC AG-414-C22]